jgi:hypothetical protein
VGRGGALVLEGVVGIAAGVLALLWPGLGVADLRAGASFALVASAPATQLAKIRARRR